MVRQAQQRYDRVSAIWAGNITRDPAVADDAKRGAKSWIVHIDCLRVASRLPACSAALADGALPQLKKLAHYGYSVLQLFHDPEKCADRSVHAASGDLAGTRLSQLLSNASIRTAVLAYALLTALVYFAFLRNIGHDDGLERRADQSAHAHLLHALVFGSFDVVGFDNIHRALEFS